MLVACRLAGLSALQAHYAGVIALMQTEHFSVRKSLPPIELLAVLVAGGRGSTADLTEPAVWAFALFNDLGSLLIRAAKQGR